MLSFDSLVEMRGFEPRSREGKNHAFYMLSLLLVFELHQAKDSHNATLSTEISLGVSSIYPTSFVCSTPLILVQQNQNKSDEQLPILNGKTLT